MVDEALLPPQSPAVRGEKSPGLVNIFEEVLRLAGNDADSAAAESIGRISAKELEEIRTLRSPPPVVRRTLEATFLLLNAANATGPLAPPAWPRVQKMLADTAFLVRMREYDPESLRSLPALTAFVASEYFGEGGGARRRSISRTQSKSSCLPSGSEVLLRSPSRGSSVHRSFAAFGARIVGQDAFEEPLTFKRVYYASRAAGALFGWCTATLVDALELPLAVATPPPATPPLAELAELGEEATDASPADVRQPTPPAPAPSPPPASLPRPVPQPDSPAPAPPTPALAAPALAPAQAPASVAARASAGAAAAAKPFYVPGTIKPVQKPEPSKRELAEKLEPDRHFELLCSFEMGYSGLTEDGEPPLQTVAAILCMRKQLSCELLGCPADIENTALNISRMQAVEAFFADLGIDVDRSADSPRTTTVNGTPGVICQVHLKRDRELRDYFILREEGDEFQVSRHTYSVIETLESEFQTRRHK